MTTAVTLPDDVAFRALAKAAQQHDEPVLKRSLLTAWATAQRGVSLPDLRRACAATDWKAATEIVQRGKLPMHVRDAIGGQVAAAFLRGVDHAKRPLRRVAVRVQRDLSDDDLRRLSPHARQWAETRAGDLVDAPADVQRRIREIVTQAVDDDGLTVDEAADLIYESIGLDDRRALALANYAGQLGDDADVVARVAEYSGQLLVARAEMIARTEIMMATNAGQQALWQTAREDGLLTDRMQRMWIVTDDPLCCEECQAIADAGPVGFDELFDGEVEFPPLHPNCRCTVGLVAAADDDSGVE